LRLKKNKQKEFINNKIFIQSLVNLAKNPSDLSGKKNKTMTTLKKGDKAPAFSGVDQDGKPHKLADYKGKKLVVFFYPKASTPGCTAEACDLRDNFSRFEANNYALLGVSADAQAKQAKFKEKYELPFPLLADEDKSVIEAFGVWGPKKFMGKEYDGIHRTTFVIDENGIIDEVIEKVKTKEHADQILK
jgi:thioredoxin-dependent peroxiredoxin